MVAVAYLLLPLALGAAFPMQPREAHPRAAQSDIVHVVRKDGVDLLPDSHGDLELRQFLDHGVIQLREDLRIWSERLEKLKLLASPRTGNVARSPNPGATQGQSTAVLPYSISQSTQ